MVLEYCMLNFFSEKIFYLSTLFSRPMEDNAQSFTSRKKFSLLKLTAKNAKIYLFEIISVNLCCRLGMAQIYTNVSIFDNLNRQIIDDLLKP